MITNIKDNFKLRNSTIAIALTTLIAVVVLTVGIHETVVASVMQPQSGIDLSGQFGSGTPEGVWSDGSTIWVVDNDSRRLVAYNRSTGAYLADKTIQLDSSNGSPRGIWSNTITIWVSDWDDTHLYAYDLGTGNRAADKDINLASHNDGPRGIIGLYGAILVVDKDDTYVYAYSQHNGNRLEDVEFDLNGSNDNPWGIWASDNDLWVSDLDDDRLYAYDFRSGAHDPSRDLRLPLENRDPRGIWADGETMWIVDDSDKRVYAIYYRHFRHTDDEIDISSVNDPAGIWTDGETMWIVDAGATPDRKLLAYRLSDGSRDSTQDTVLSSDNRHPRDVWSDGTYVWVLDYDDHRVYVYDLGSDDGVSLSNRSFDLPQDIASPTGITVDGTIMFISSPGSTTLYAYSTLLRHRQTQWNLELAPENTDARGVWSDGETIWVLDTADAHVYAYELNYQDPDFNTGTVYRKRSAEFRPSPHNRGHAAGFTGHGPRFWVADADDDLLYAYAGVNTPAAFPQPTVEFQVHDTIGGESYVGTVPAGTDGDGDTLSYGLGGPDAGHFTFDRQSREIYTAAGTPGFQKGDQYSLTVYVSDNKSRLDGVDSRNDDAIGITVGVWENSNPRFNMADHTLFYIEENVAPGSSVGELNVVDPDGDVLSFDVAYRAFVYPDLPFTIDGGQLKLKPDDTLDYEYRRLYRLKLRVKDAKDLNGDPDGAWDHRVNVRVHVTNVDEPGEVTLNSAQPVEGAVIVATPTDPDGIIVGDGTNIHWTVERGADADSGPWTEAHKEDTPDNWLEYVPVAADDGNYLRITANYFDNQASSTYKAAQAVSENPVAGASATNHPPAFDDGGSTTRTIDENASGGVDVGIPVAATDDDMGDTLTYGLAGLDAGRFGIDAGTGQISLGAGAELDHEANDAYSLTVQVRDSKDADGNADTAWDAYIAVMIQVANVDETGVVSLTTDSPEVNVVVTASLTDPDDGVSNLAWQWQRADGNSPNTWDDIGGETHNSYTPVADDVGKFLRAHASYDDGQGTGKEATSDATSAVAEASNGSPGFDEGASASRSVAEGAAVGTPVGAAVTATDPDGDALTYTLADGQNSNLFSVNPATGKITVTISQPLDYEVIPSVALTLLVSDRKDAGHSPDDVIDDTITVTINLVNVEEAGAVRLTPTEPEVGEPVIASLADPDGSVSILSWQWQRANSDTPNNWDDISDATPDSYTPTAADVGKFLRAHASYDDGEGTGKEATSDATNLVTLTANGAPEFDEGAHASRFVAEGASFGTQVGAAVTATDPDDDALAYTLAGAQNSNLFAVIPTTGRIVVTNSQLLDYETNPSVALTVQVSDRKDAGNIPDDVIDDTITITVNLVNADDPGRVTLNTAEPEVDSSIAASLTDQDGDLASLRWQWSKSANGSTDWENIAGASTDGYTPSADDEGMYLRATVGYTDGEGPGKNAEAITSQPVVSNNAGRNGSSGGGSGQQTPRSPDLSFYEQCVRDQQARSVANCGGNSFASYRVELDGRYTIDWSEWDAEHPDVTGYTILINEFVYKKYYDGETEVNDEDLADVYESCQFVDGRWDCQGRLKSNYSQDMNGGPTQVRVVAQTVDRTELTHALEKAGRWMSDQTYHRWSGDETDPNNEPTEVTYRRMKFEIDQYHFQAHGGSGGRGTVLVNGANGFDEQSE